MRPLNLGETLDAAIAIVRRELLTLVKVVLVIALPIELLDVVIIRSTTDVYSVTGTFGGSRTVYSDQSAFVGGQAMIAVLGLVQYLIATAACFRVVAATYLDEHVGAAASLRFGARRALPTLWLLILNVLALLVVVAIVLIPAAAVGAPAVALVVFPLVIWLAIAWSLAVPAMLVEGRGGIGALRRSFSLIRGRWWPTLGRLFVAYLLVGVVGGIVSAGLTAVVVVAVSKTSFAALAISRLIGVAIGAVTTPLIVAVITLVYFDLRVRKEGFDLQMLADRMGAQPPPAGGRPSPVAPLPREPDGGGERWAGPRAGGSDSGSGERDAFGHPVAPAPPIRWAPPQAPRPQSQPPK